MSTSNVIVFGPTGNVGSAAALAAQSAGANVFLGMRDPTKPLPSSLATTTSFSKVQADLTDPASLTKAVTTTGATRAFIYLPHGATDFLKPSLVALKAAGIDFVVLLGTYSTQQPIDEVKPEDPISFSHAQTEKGLREVFGTGAYVAVRGGYFATNTLRWKAMFPSGEIKLKGEEGKFDFLSTDDLGAVAGTILAKGPEVVKGETVVEVVGPQMISQKEAVRVIAKVLGKDLKSLEGTDEEIMKQYVEGFHLPEPVAKYLVAMMQRRVDENDGMYREPGFGKAIGNVERFLGRPATKFEDWVKENKDKF